MDMFRTMRGRLVGVAVILSALVVGPAYSQSTQADLKGATFDVASVKRDTSAAAASTIGFEPGGRFVAINMPVASLIQTAYGTSALPRPQIIGGPGWIDADRFDVTAVTDRNPSQEQRQMMLRALLADRFNLSIHRETRELPVYNLVKSSADGKRDIRLRVSDIDCAALRNNGRTPTPEQLRPCMTAFGFGSLRLNGPVSQFALALARMVDRPVIDRTGLGATQYDWALEWIPDQRSQISTGATPSDPSLPSSIFSAIQEQLGLKLESAKGPFEVLVIDHVEKPTPD